MGDDFLLVREGGRGAMDPTDEYGVEAGLQLVEAAEGEVTLVSMGPEPAVDGHPQARVVDGRGPRRRRHRPVAPRR